MFKNEENELGQFISKLSDEFALIIKNLTPFINLILQKLVSYSYYCFLLMVIQVIIKT
jgi:hypothetical protein